MRVLLVPVLCLGLIGCNCGGEVVIGSTGGGSGTGGNTGTGGNSSVGGGNGSTGGGNGSVGGGNGSTGGGSGATAGGFIEPTPDAGDYDGGCGPIDAGNPTLRRRCYPSDVGSECDPALDSALVSAGVQMSLLNGVSGNGFDDDCDGKVDEGCSCPGNGQTKDCWLVPATQADPANNQPVGWCNPNAKGSVDCVGAELATWSGVCRGATAPVVSDTCSMGDFNCDGLQGNSAVTGCACPDSVTCPTQPLTIPPYPPPATIPLVDGSAWITDMAQRAQAMNWTWTVLGGDCDNVLPFPTFALYNQTNSGAMGARINATRQPVRFDPMTQKYVAAAGEPVIALQAVNFGNGVMGGQIYPAFGLSGDYLVQGEFDLGGKHYVCTQKVQVRAPGVRAELCWDTVGGVDIDLHFARLQGTTCTEKGWDNVCTGRAQDCYYANCASGDRGWGYAMSAFNTCHGWGSKRLMTAQCDNPRLDQDNINCNRMLSDPLADGVTAGQRFCGPENINVDNPNNGDKFIVGVNHFSGATPSKPHVNLYCNGQRVLSVGYNPATGQTSFPVLRNAGQDLSGDFWNVAIITANVTGGMLTSCNVETIPSHHADQTRDGVTMNNAGNGICVESRMNMSVPMFNYTSHRFVDMGSQQVGLTQGSQPVNAADFCKH